MMTYFIGCDAHRQTSTFQQITDQGALGLTMNVDNNKESLFKFLDLFDQPAIVTLEAGRNWWFLHQVFKDHPNVEKINVVDPRRNRNLSKEFSVKSGYGRARNDRIDSEMMAELTRLKIAPTIFVPTPEQLEVRSINRFRINLVYNNTRAKNHVHSLLAMYGKYASVQEMVYQSEASQSILNPLPKYIQSLIHQLIQQITTFDEQIEQCEKLLDQWLPEKHPQMAILLSTPGFGITLARTVLVEILDISHFKSPKYLVSYSGLAPIIEDSDNHPKSKTKLNHHCNYYLKFAFVEAAHHASRHSKYREKYNSDVKHHGRMIAKFTLARRLIKTIYWMLIRQQLYHG
jgi:transposase